MEHHQDQLVGAIEKLNETGKDIVRMLAAVAFILKNKEHYYENGINDLLLLAAYRHGTIE